MQNKRAFSDDYTFEVNEKVVSIVAKETGFQGIEPQALEAFTSLLDSYVDKMLSSAHRFAELGNRAKPNIHDITRSLENSGVEISNFKEYLHTKVNDTKTAKLKKKYFKTQKMTSTLESIPNFLPSDNEDSEDEAEDHTTEGGMPTYVPRHLPSFPSKHSFRQTPIYINRPDDPQKVRELTSEQSRTVEENLKKLMSAENQLLRQANVDSANAMLESTSTTTSSNIMMPIVNYEVFIQRRKRQKQSGTTLNVEGSDEPKPNSSSTTNNASDMGGLDLDTTQVGGGAGAGTGAEEEEVEESTQVA
ncbi:bromodomain associated domain protein [Mucor ambiguus]|uniref:Transcription initiation factor TFIID subunit 8 n=1 Tax=Mucor ambiguus TaxID=91626 RepID=A0A0C9MBL7_9FUNG|nr:bromodomain associated domain protein [Mucor ambiguus]